MGALVRRVSASSQPTVDRRKISRNNKARVTTKKIHLDTSDPGPRGVARWNISILFFWYIHLDRIPLHSNEECVWLIVLISRARTAKEKCVATKSTEMDESRSTAFCSLHSLLLSHYRAERINVCCAQFFAFSGVTVVLAAVGLLRFEIHVTERIVFVRILPKRFQSMSCFVGRVVSTSVRTKKVGGSNLNKNEKLSFIFFCQTAAKNIFTIGSQIIVFDLSRRLTVTMPAHSFGNNFLLFFYRSRTWLHWIRFIARSDTQKICETWLRVHADGRWRVGPRKIDAHQQSLPGRSL